jgi:hypothetical protein
VTRSPWCLGLSSWSVPGPWSVLSPVVRSQSSVLTVKDQRTKDGPGTKGRTKNQPRAPPLISRRSPWLVGSFSWRASRA